LKLPLDYVQRSPDFYRDAFGVTDDERRTIVEMMAKGSYASIIHELR
jgi:hypothetical protein